MPPGASVLTQTSANGDRLYSIKQTFLGGNDLDGVSWEVIHKSRDLVRLQGRLYPKSITVSARGLKDLTGRDCLVDLHFSYVGGMELEEYGDDVACIAVDFKAGVFDETVLTKIDFQAARSAAYAEWASLPSGDQPVEVKVSAESRAEWFKKTRELGKQLELAEVAMVFLQAPTRGAQNVKDYLGYGSIATANRRVQEARKAGLIPPVGSSEEVLREFREAIVEHWPQPKAAE